MNAQQVTAFEEGTGAFFTAAELLNLIQSVGVAILITYVAWLCVTAYKEFGDGQLFAKDMMAVWLRSIAMLMFLLYLFIN